MKKKVEKVVLKKNIPKVKKTSKTILTNKADIKNRNKEKEVVKKKNELDIVVEPIKSNEKVVKKRVRKKPNEETIENIIDIVAEKIENNIDVSDEKDLHTIEEIISIDNYDDLKINIIWKSYNYGIYKAIPIQKYELIIENMGYCWWWSIVYNGQEISSNRENKSKDMVKSKDVAIEKVEESFYKQLRKNKH